MSYNFRHEIKRYTWIAAGVIIESLSYALFLVPNKIAPGGMTAVAIIVNSLTNGFLPVGFSYFLLNLPWLGLAWKKMGHKYITRTLVISFISFIFTDLFIFFINKYLPAKLTSDMLLASVFGGILNGLGIGLTFKNRASAGGTDLISQVIHYYTKFPFGQTVLIVDSVVIIGLAFYFQNANLFIYAMVALVISSFVIDAVQEGISFTKCMSIITTETEQIRENLILRLGRGFTIIDVKGGFTGDDKKMLVMAVHRSQLAEAKKIILETDPKSFIMIGPLNEVLGEGFKNPKMEEW